MAKIISQETYDEVLKENIVEFSMSVAEARDETVKQFEAQGINLGNIIRDLEINEETGVPVINEAIEKVKEWKMLNREDLQKFLALGTAEMNKTVPHRVLASKLGLLACLLEIMDAETETDVLTACVVAAGALMNQNPDIFDENCMKAVKVLLGTQTDAKLVCETLKWVQKACIMHEMNRQMVMGSGVLMDNLKPLLKNENPQVIREVCGCFRYLVLDDDVRVEFGKAHEHAREIATETLPILTELLKTFKSNQNVIADLFLTIASLIVRNEFCQVVEDSGGLKYTLDAMVEYPDSVKVTREAFKLLKALAGNDKVKVHIIQSGAAVIIESALNKFKVNDTIAKAALSCISVLALRVTENSTALFETGLPETILETMRLHAKNKIVLRNAAWAIRNMVSRSREQCETFIGHGAEEVLNAAMKDHPTIAQDCKAALRDLGCKVHLNEEWKGKSEYQIAE